MATRRSGRSADDEPAPLVAAADRIGDRWTLLVVDALRRGPLRFGELSDAVAGIAPNVLTARLRQLEADGVVRSTPYSRRPLRMEYELTGAGAELGGALALLAAWGRRQSAAASGVPTGEWAPELEHRDCGTQLVTRLWCPTCDRPVDDPGADDLERL